MGRPVKGVKAPKASEVGEVTNTIYLTFINHNSNKFYKIEELKFNNCHHVRCTYGKIGKTDNVVWHLVNANRTMQQLKTYNLVRSKRMKGYKEEKQAQTKEESKNNSKAPTGRFANILK